MPNLGNQHVLHFEFPCQKLLKLYHNTYILYSAWIYLQNRIRVYDLIEHISCYFKVCP